MKKTGSDSITWTNLSGCFVLFRPSSAYLYNMLELKLRKTVLCLDFSFFAVVALYLLLDESGFGLAAIGACALHETAHLIAMALFGVPAQRVTLYGAGIRITSDLERVPPLRRIVILSAGCLANFAAALVFWRLGEPSAFAVELFTGIFNLLPLGALDGAGLLKMLVIKRCKAENVDRVMKLASVISMIVVAAAVIYAGGAASFTLITTALYIIILSGTQ